MDYKDVRKGITKANFNEKNSPILALEIVIISIAFGLVAQSWWWGGGVFMFFIIAISIKPIAFILAILFSSFWGFFGGAIGSAIGSTGGMVVLGTISFFIAAGAHFSALEYYNDL